MSHAGPSTARLRPPTTNALRTAKWLVGAYTVLSMLTVVAIITFSAVAPSLVNPQAQVRSVIVAATSSLTLLFAVRATRGDQKALLRLRIVVAVIFIAVVAVLLFLPLPLWMIVEQATCGVLLAATAVVIFRPSPHETTATN